MVMSYSHTAQGIGESMSNKKMLKKIKKLKSK